MRFTHSFFAIAVSLSLLSGCNYLPDWLGADDADDVILPGERIALKRRGALFEPEIPAGEASIQLPPERPASDWNQSFGSASGVSDHLQFTELPQKTLSATLGDGDDFATAILPAPVVENDRIFALDGDGTLSAHSTETLEQLWQSPALESADSDDALLGGGVAVASDVVYAANDEGRIVAISAKEGKLYWQQELKLPLRAAPRLIGSLVLIQSADNQLLALNRRNGEIRWIHEGLNDQASQLQATMPAAGGDRLLATYSSGEVTAIALSDGSVLWSDMLAGSAQTALQEDRFGVLSALMTPRVSFAGSAKSFTAYLTRNGRRVWERRVPLSAHPWLTGTTLYMLTSDQQLLAMNGSNGKILWVQNLPSQIDKDEPITWQHPIVASGKVWMVNNRGQLIAHDAQTGEATAKLEIADDIAAEPVIVGETLYLVSRDATLYALR
jgi:outer membrane protein assembly factor BamB